MIKVISNAPGTFMEHSHLFDPNDALHLQVQTLLSSLNLGLEAFALQSALVTLVWCHQWSMAPLEPQTPMSKLLNSTSCTME